MRILDKNNKEVAEVDLKKGYLENDKIFLRHHDAVIGQEEQSHYVVTAEYPNGGKDIKKIIDIPKKENCPAWDEYEDIYRYLLYADKKEDIDFEYEQANKALFEKVKLEMEKASLSADRLRREQEEKIQTEKIKQEQMIQKLKEEEKENLQNLKNQEIKEQQQEQLNADRLNALEAAMCEVLGVQPNDTISSSTN